MDNENQTKEKNGTFLAFVLLSNEEFDKTKLLDDLKEEWDMELIDEGNDDSAFVINYKDELVAVSLVPAAIPDQEAEEAASTNYMWSEAVEVTKQHQAHLMVVVMGKDADQLEASKDFVKVVDCCCKQPNVLGVYTSGTVFEPKFYRDFAQIMKENDSLPIYNLVFFGLYQGEKGICCYTDGMEVFNKDEMEILNAEGDPKDIRDFLSMIANYVISCDVILQDGETIGFTEDDKHKIVRSKGVSLEGDTLKISYEQE